MRMVRVSWNFLYFSCYLIIQILEFEVCLVSSYRKINCAYQCESHIVLCLIMSLILSHHLLILKE